MTKEHAGDSKIIEGLNNWLHGKGYVQSAPDQSRAGSGYITGLSDAANRLINSGAQNILVKVEAPQSVDLNVNVTGAGIQPGSTRGTLPLSAPAPRGTTMATPPAQPVPR